MNTETERDAAPFKWGDIVAVTYGGGEIPSSVVGEVRGFGNYPAAWLQMMTPEGETVVFLGSGVTVRFMNDLKRKQPPASPRTPTGAQP